MVRTAESKFGFWLAGYYEDFIGSRCVTDDSNTPSSDGAYDSNNTHHGNTMNGEATLNPRYRWSVRDRVTTGEVTSSSNYLLANDGVARWATLDNIRLGNGETWTGRSQLQFPSSWAHPNRLRFDKTQNDNSDDAYIKFCSTYDSSAHYFVPGGDDDATYGRDTVFSFNAATWALGIGGNLDDGTNPDFMQSAHLTGVWAGERAQLNTSATHRDHPERMFKQIRSKAGKPFLCVRTYMNQKNDHRVNNVAPSGENRPVIHYGSGLNSRADGDTFGIRMAVHSHNGNTDGTEPPGQETNIDSSVPVEYVLRVGFPSVTTFDATTGSQGATPAITWTFRPDDGHGLKDSNVRYYHMSYDASQSQPDVEPWFDLDFVIDYTNGKFKVYHDGTEITASNDSAGAYSSGYALGGSIPASDMTGWELFVTNYDSDTNTDHRAAVMTTMIDRVALYRPLTDALDNTNPSAVSSWSCTAPVNGISSAEITISDDDTEQNLTPFFSDDAITDLRLLMFSGNIHRPLWSGIVETMAVDQHGTAQTREITISARDSLSLLERQIAAWEIGQIGSGETDVVLSRRNEVGLLADAMFTGASRLEPRSPTLGFESSDYDELREQRLTRKSSHPIQVYNNEDDDGPNSTEEDWLGYGVVAFDKNTSSEVVALFNGDLPSSISAGTDVSVFGSGYHDVTNYSAQSGDMLTTYTFPGRTTSHDAFKFTGSGKPTFTDNTSANLEQMANVPDVLPAAQANYVHLVFNTTPTYANGKALKNGGLVVVTSHENANAATTPPAYGVFAVQAIIQAGGKTVVKTNRKATISKTNFATPLKFSLDRGHLKPTDESINYRNAHALWMRDLPKSPWFRKHFGIIDFAPLEAGAEIKTNFNADTTSIECFVDLFDDDAAKMSGVGIVRDTDGFLDTFTYTGIIHKSGPNSTFIVGVKGLSRNHTTSSTVYLLGTSDDYKHTWLLWSDMRNNGDANADGGFQRKNFGLMQPISENYSVNIAFTDQFDNEGGYTSYTDLKMGTDVDLWEIDAEVDPSTNAPWSLPLLQGTYDGSAQAAETRGITIGKTSGYLTAETSQYTNLAVGDKVLIFDDPFTAAYNTHHTITAITGSGSTRTFEFSGTTAVHVGAGYTFSSTNGNGPYMAKIDDAYTVHTDLATWENKGGSFLVVDASPFFNLNTFTNGGRYGRVSGGRTNLGDYETQYHGFPILMDSYWNEATSRPNTNAVPYSFHENYHKWNQEAAELNRTVELGDKVIETKPSTSNIAGFDEFGMGKIRATRGSSTSQPSTENFYYTWDGKLDSSVVESATSATAASADPFVITCSGGDFVNDGVEVGMRVRNVTAKWVAQITAVTATTITVDRATIYAETGSTRQDVVISDSISVPQQLYDITLHSDNAQNFTPQQAEDFLAGIRANSTFKANGSNARIALNANNSNATGAFDEVIIGASVSPRYALRFLMNIGGFVESANSGTYWMSDKTRFMWSLMLADTWLTQASAPCWFDFSTVPQSQGMTTDGTNTNFDSFGSAYDARGGKSLLTIVREANESIGTGDAGSHDLGTTFQIGRDNAIEIRPAYNCGEAINRNNLHVSQMQASVSGHVTNVRVYYNNGASFADHPEPSLGSSYRWKIVEMPEITNHTEALFIAKEQYRQAKTKAIRVTGEIIRDLDDTDKMLNGRYGYIADVSREIERGAAAQAVFNTVIPTNAYNAVWSSQNGNLFPGMVNALDGNLGTAGSDRYLRSRYGKGFIAASGSTSSSTESWNNRFYWWGANSLAHAVQVVHVPTGTPLVSDTTGNDLRVFVALKDGQTGTDIDNAEFTVGFSDVSFDTAAQVPFTNFYSGSSSFAPDFSASLATNGYQSVNVSKNGFYEVTIPTSYGAPASSKFVISVNVDYLRDVLRHRCGDPTASGILHNAHDITELGPSSWTATNADSLFPLGARQYSDMSGAFDTRYAWYAPRLHVVEDLRWRPGTQVTYTDSGLGLSSEAMVITSVDWGVDGRDIETINLNLERDQTKSAGGLVSYLFPRISRRRGGTPSSSGVGAGGGSNRPLPPPQVGPGGQGGFGGDTGTPYRPGGGSLGGSAFTPSAIQGGFSSNGSATGGFVSEAGMASLSPSVVNRMTGRMNVNDMSVSSGSFGILGQEKPPAPTNTQRSVEGIDSSISPTSSGATMTEEGWVFPGIVNPEVSHRFTHTQSLNIRVPDDVADEIITVSGSYTMEGTGSDTAVITVTVTCEETGSSVTRSLNLSGGETRRDVVFITGLVDGASTGGNNMTVEVKRTPGSGSDDASYSAVVLNNIRVNFQRFSTKGFAQGDAFRPY